MRKFDFDDILIEPEILTDIDSRSEIDVHWDNGFLPLITAPMDTVISEENEEVFLDHEIIPCLPRGEKSVSGFTSYSLNEFNKLIELGIETPPFGRSMLLIDMANGHMEAMVNAIEKAKAKYPELVLMVGNVANPRTYHIMSEAGADFVRVGIGNGNGCLTTQQTGVGYPMASLIKECYEESCTLDNPAKIVADGGMKDYSDVIKALALGADYVMMGSIFNKALESSGPCYDSEFASRSITVDHARELMDHNMPVYKMFRGMSTKEVQRKWGKEVVKTSEGIVALREVEYTLGGWTENFKHYLRSAMSYTGARTLEDFVGKVRYNLISDNALRRFQK